MERARLVRKGWTAGFIAWIEAGRPRADCRVVVDARVFRPRQLDEDNAWAGLKPVLDGIFSDRGGAGARMTPDDNPEWVQIGTMRWTHCRAPYVILQITESPASERAPP